VIIYHWFRASTLHGVDPLSSHVVMVSRVPSCISLVRLSKRMSSSIALRFDSVWKFLPQWRMSFFTLELENVLSHSEYPTRVIGPRRLSSQARNKQSHEAQSDLTRCYVAHARKEKLHEKPRSFPPANYPDVLLSPWSMCPSSFLVLPLLL
jgi:hypothetical protein